MLIYFKSASSNRLFVLLQMYLRALRCYLVVLAYINACVHSIHWVKENRKILVHSVCLETFVRKIQVSSCYFTYLGFAIWIAIAFLSLYTNTAGLKRP